MVAQTVGMPQTPRVPGPADLAVVRLTWEREQRGWTPSEVARRLTEQGFRINQSSVWSIERDPRRKITLAEAVAFAQLYGIDVGELCRPPRDVTPETVREIIDRLTAWARDSNQLLLDLLNILWRVEKLGADTEALAALRSLDIGAVGVPTGDLKRRLAIAAEMVAKLAQALPEHGLAISFDDE